MASLLSQSAGSGRLTLPVSDSTRSPLSTRPEVRRWAEPQTPPLGTPPRRVGVAPSTVRLSNGGWPWNRAMVPTNQEASGQGKRPLPPREKRLVIFGRTEEIHLVLLPASALISSCHRCLLSSRPGAGVWFSVSSSAWSAGAQVAFRRCSDLLERWSYLVDAGLVASRRRWAGCISLALGWSHLDAGLVRSSRRRPHEAGRSLSFLLGVHLSVVPSLSRNWISACLYILHFL